MWYSIALFVHVLGAIGLFSAVSIVIVAWVRMRRAATLAAGRVIGTDVILQLGPLRRVFGVEGAKGGDGIGPGIGGSIEEAARPQAVERAADLRAGMAMRDTRLLLGGGGEVGVRPAMRC